MRPRARRIHARSVSVKARDRHIVENADLSVETGEFVGLIGPNGAGKSTLLRAMLGLRPRISGSVMLDGETMEKLSARERACAVAYLPQDRHVEWRLPARDIVRLGRYPHRHRFGGSRSRDEAAVDRALALVEVEDLADRPVASLSGGERTRVLLARALAVEAPLLLADEPIAALDPYHQLHVMEILRGLSRQGVGVLCVIHDLALAMRFSDRLVLMGAGRVLADGPPRDVLSSDRLETIYRIDAQEGERHGSRYLVPWSRI